MIGDPNLELEKLVPRSIAIIPAYPEHGESRPLVPSFPLTNVFLVTS